MGFRFDYTELEPRHDAYPSYIRIAEIRLASIKCGLHHQRRPNVGRPPHGFAKESGRGHTDDGERMRLQCDALADDRYISGESALPKAVAQHRHRMRARRLVIGGGQRATNDRVHAQNLKILSGNKLHFSLFRPGAGTRVGYLHPACAVEGGKDAGEELSANAKLLEHLV